MEDTASVPGAESPAEAKERFDTLAERWKRETSHQSSVQRIVGNLAYREIIAMGPEVIPFILGDLQRQPDHWFTALEHLTGAVDEVPDCDNMADMAKAWVEWGQAKGFI